MRLTEVYRGSGGATVNCEGVDLLIGQDGTVDSLRIAGSGEDGWKSGHRWAATHQILQGDQPFTVRDYAVGHELEVKEYAEIDAVWFHIPKSEVFPPGQLTLKGSRSPGSSTWVETTLKLADQPAAEAPPPLGGTLS